MTNTTWAPPAIPPAAKPRMSTGKKWLIAGAVAATLAVIGATGNHDSGSSGGTGGSFSVAAGWTIDRVSNLSVKIETDDGVSSAKADCAMKSIAYGTTWLEWQALGSAGQFVAIRSAEADC